MTTTIKDHQRQLIIFSNFKDYEYDTATKKTDKSMGSTSMQLILLPSFAQLGLSWLYFKPIQPPTNPPQPPPGRDNYGEPGNQVPMKS